MRFEGHDSARRTHNRRRNEAEVAKKEDLPVSATIQPTIVEEELNFDEHIDVDAKPRDEPAEELQ